MACLSALLWSVHHRNKRADERSRGALLHMTCGGRCAKRLKNMACSHASVATNDMLCTSCARRHDAGIACLAGRDRRSHCHSKESNLRCTARDWSIFPRFDAIPRSRWTTIIWAGTVKQHITRRQRTERHRAHAHGNNCVQVAQ